MHPRPGSEVLTPGGGWVGAVAPEGSGCEAANMLDLGARPSCMFNVEQFVKLRIYDTCNFLYVCYASKKVKTKLKLACGLISYPLPATTE